MSISDDEIRNRHKVICSGMDINVMEKGINSPRQLEQQPPVDSRMGAKACWEVGKAILQLDDDNDQIVDTLKVFIDKEREDWKGRLE